MNDPTIRSSHCPFCAIADGETPAEWVAECSRFVAFLDIDPITPGHCLVVPRRHVAELDELTEAEWTSLGELVRSVRGMLLRALAPAGISLMQNGGAFADVPHFHMHVIPRHAGDGFGWLLGNAPPSASADANREAMGALLRLHAR